jgi:uncharacterized protein YukE
MPTYFDHNTVASQGGVSWAKRIGEQLNPGAIQTQIDGYSAVTESLNQIIDTLNTANNQIRSTWTGDAATAASQTFTGVTNHAQTVVGTVNNTVATLKSAKAASMQAKAALAAVPDEVPVPHAGIGASIVSGILGDQNSGQIAQAHNLAAQNDAANALNTLSANYGAAANDLQSIAGAGDTQETFAPAGGTEQGAFNLGSEHFGSIGSSSYPGTPGNSRTSLQGVGIPVTSTQRTPTLATQSIAESIQPNMLIADPGPITSSVDPIAGLLGAQLVPAPMGSASGSTLTTAPGGSWVGGPTSGIQGKALVGDGEVGSQSDGVFGEGGFGSDVSVLNGGSFSTGKSYETNGPIGKGSFDPDEGPINGGTGVGVAQESISSDEWVSPAVGSDESLLVKGTALVSGSGRIISVYEGSTDLDGNTLGMIGGGARPLGTRKEDDVRGQRPGYLKEDPEWWKSAQPIVPSVIE